MTDTPLSPSLGSDIPSPRSRVSAGERLAQLAEVFSVEDFKTQQELSAKAASVYLARWQAQGLIARLGPRSGLWVNLSKVGSIGLDQRIQGVLRKHPDALLAGPSALALAGWIDAPEQPIVVVPQGSSKAQFDGITILTRTPRVHAQLKEASEVSESLGLPVVAPEVALADWNAHADAPLTGVTEQQAGAARQAAREREWASK